MPWSLSIDRTSERSDSVVVVDPGALRARADRRGDADRAPHNIGTLYLLPDVPAAGPAEPAGAAYQGWPGASARTGRMARSADLTAASSAR
jgi:hypothetical protein